MNFQFVLDPTASRTWRFADGGGALVKAVALTDVSKAKLLMTFLTPIHH